MSEGQREREHVLFTCALLRSLNDISVYISDNLTLETLDVLSKVK